MDLDAFVSEHGAEWNRLQTLAGRRRKKLTAAEVDELLALYRRTATHLSVVRSRAADPTLVAWLSRLVLQARSAVTPSTGFSAAAVGRFFTVSFPLEIYRSARWVLGVGAAFLTLTGVLITMVVNDPNIALSFLDADQIQQLVDHDFEAYYSSAPPENFAALVWTNNSMVSAVCLAGGVLVIPAVYFLWQNVLNTGIVGGVMVGNGRADTFFGLLLIHGMLELTCVFIAGGVGLRIAWAFIAPGPLRTRAQALAAAGRSGIVVALGLVAPLAVSGLVEGFVTPLPVPVVFKLAFGFLVWASFVGYVTLCGYRATHDGQTSDVAAHEREALAPTV